MANSKQPLTAWISRLNWPALRAALLTFLVIRLLTTGLMFAFQTAIPVHDYWPMGYVDEGYLRALQEGSWFQRMVLLPWYRYDTVHYVKLIQEGYAGNLIQTVWPPLYPALGRLVNWVVGEPLASALIVSNLAAIAAYYFLYRLAEDLGGASRARQTLFFFSIYPPTFLLLAGYSESLFLALTLAWALALRRKRLLLAGCLSGLASLSRVQGVVMVLPMAWYVAYTAWKAYHDQPGWPRAVFAQLVRWSPVIALPGLAYGAYTLWIHLVLAAPWPWLLRSYVWNSHLGFPLEGIIGGFTAILGRPVNPAFPIYVIILDLLLLALAIYLLVHKPNHIPVHELMFGWVTLLLITTQIDNTHVFMSLSRYLTSLFPIYFTLGFAALTPAKRLTLFGFFTGIQVFLVALFHQMAWVA